MDHEKAYKEALERARAGKPMDEVFPELKESEDERIIERLLEYFRGFYDRFSCKNNVNVHWEGLEVKKVIAYLEKQKEQKPAEWSEEDEKYHQYILVNCMHYAMVMGHVDETHNEQLHEGAEIWLKSLRSKQKQEWCKEDEENFKWFDRFFRAESIVLDGRDIPQDKYLWFKSLRPQPKGEWSKGEQRMLDCVEYSMRAAMCIPDNIIKWTLEHLRPQPHWKPSEEKMKALDSAINYLTKHTCTPGNPLLISLYHDLQKLL